MTYVAQSRQTLFAREGMRLWKDTGRHVLVLPGTGCRDVVVLGGGGAEVWRILEQPLGAAEIQQRFSSEGAAPPLEELERCLAELAMLGLVVEVEVTAA